MTQTINFTRKVKIELFQKTKPSAKNFDFLLGFLWAKSQLDLEKNIFLIIKDELTKEKLLAFLKELKIEHQIENSNLIIFKNQIDFQTQINNLSNFFAGFFCGGGTISDFKHTSYHLELSSYYEQFIDLVLEKLNKYNFGFQKISYRQKYLIYLKKHEKIADFLKAIEARNAYFEFEEEKIKRDFYNNINRIDNIDFSNINRIANANGRHIDNINLIFAKNLESKFSQHQLKAFEIVLANPGESLQSLSEIMIKNGIKITRSGLNHWLRKLDEVVKEFKN
ncbi:DNA-binding protein WhiA [Mycoplasmopsis columbinasalis]|uniref:Probable cell division protein WhiA n=1 Tax=Mycoplasmopsis columbinasalis TaxID=114880 RepID=A0A449B9Y5_9BACT|nr:DNA-binding protein WhiA [Mycoplasmopsis columbinasalis]VEU78003.1 Uncharacterized protein conserved in bacteria [Mycoplasmopsis columbinasalis]